MLKLKSQRRIKITKEELEKENAELKKHIEEIKKYKICTRCTISDVQKLEEENGKLKKKEEILLDRILTLQKICGRLTDELTK